jgi:predicted transcriptional regulator
MTFVDHAEFIWNETGTQQQIADVMGWSRGKVSNYALLILLRE